MVSPSTFLESLLSHPLTFYTIGCYPHYTKELLSPGQFRQFEELVEKAGENCVAIGECGLDTSKKNDYRMALQAEMKQVSYGTLQD